jgi:AhpD family alkylhydroperoxidase
MEERMEARLKSTSSPEVTGAVQQLFKAVHAGGVDPLLLGLVHLRASQINGCAPCTYAGVQAAKKQGETDERLHSVVTWRETPFFTEPERAALALTEAATRVEDGQAGVTDEIWAAAAEHFDEKQLSAIVLNIALTGFFNRINRAVREQAGKNW